MSSGISEKQIDIIRRHMNGETEESIALNTGMSVHTVRYHKKRLFRMLVVNNTAAAIKKLQELKKLKS